jgi:hypothetical protein
MCRPEQGPDRTRSTASKRNVERRSDVGPGVVGRYDPAVVRADW